VFNLSLPGRETASFKTQLRITNLFFIALCLVDGRKGMSRLSDGTPQGSEGPVHTFASGNCM